MIVIGDTLFEHHAAQGLRVKTLETSLEEEVNVIDEALSRLSTGSFGTVPIRRSQRLRTSR
jgi:hypothetical protein